MRNFDKHSRDSRCVASCCVAFGHAIPGCSVRVVTLAAAALLCSIPAAQAMPIQRTASSLPAASASLVYPLMGPRESSAYGMRRHPIHKGRTHHAGTDLAAPKGAPIRAIADGQVIYSDPLGAYGNFVTILHANGLTSHYGHCETSNVRVGQFVRAGESIATVGSTGASTGPHLHFEIRLDGKPQDPEKYLPGLELPAQG